METVAIVGINKTHGAGPWLWISSSKPSPVLPLCLLSTLRIPTHTGNPSPNTIPLFTSGMTLDPSSSSSSRRPPLHGTRTPDPVAATRPGNPPHFFAIKIELEYSRIGLKVYDVCCATQEKALVIFHPCLIQLNRTQPITQKC